ncbi:MAG: excalibur calcium-binding domain-containing protein [Jatrophihabitantaceae bacterium]
MKPRAAAALVATVLTGSLACQASPAAGMASATSTSAAAKATSYAYLATSRTGAATYVNALIKQGSSTGIIRSPHRTVYLQRELATGWQTMLSRLTDTQGQFAVGFISAPAYRYRLVVTASTSALATTSGTALSAPQIVRYANCAAVHAVATYAHGIGRPGAVDHVSGASTPVTDYFRSTALYQANAASLDRDKDGIACESH